MFLPVLAEGNKILTHFKSYSLMYFLCCIFSVEKNKMFNCLTCLVLKRHANKGKIKSVLHLNLENNFDMYSSICFHTNQKDKKKEDLDRGKINCI